MDINDSREAVQAYTQELGLTVLALLDESGSVAQSYYVRGVPASVFMDRKGTIEARYTGPLTESLIKRYLTPIL